MNYIKLLVVVISFAVLKPLTTCAQTFANNELSLGQWRLHAPFKSAIQVAKVNNKIYCAANTGLYYLDTDDNTLHVIGTEQGLASNQVNILKYSEVAQTLVIVHTNYNIDLLHNGKIYNISDIKTKSIIGFKTINDVYINGTNAYLACGFGIVKINLTKQEIADTYYLVPQGQSMPVNGVIAFNNYLYASTDKGLYRSLLNNPAIADYRSWKLDSMGNNGKWYNKKFKQMTVANNQLIVNNYSPAYWQDTLMVSNAKGQWSKPSTFANYDVSDLTTIDNEIVVTFTGAMLVYDVTTLTLLRYGIPSTSTVSYKHIQTISDDNGGYYIADNRNGIVHCNKKFGNINSYSPVSSFFSSGFRMNFIDSTLYVSGGGYDLSGFSNYRLYGVQSYKNFEWNYNFTGNRDLTPNPFGATTSSNVNSKNKAQKYFTSWGYGLLETNDSAGITKGKLYNASNSALQDQPGNVGFIALNNTVYDKNGNLWMDNTYSAKPLVVKTQDNQWRAFGLTAQGRTKQLIIARSGYKWLAFALGQGIAVYNDNNTLDDITDDEYRVLTNNEINGNLHSLEITSLAEDANGDIWVGTAKGVTVFYNADNVLKKTGGTYDAFQAQQIKINTTGNVEYLLEAEYVNAIVVDDANRKWITTANSGVYLVSKNGTEQLKHFTVDNSPLIINEIKSVAINNLNGEVFFGHDYGIQSYKGEAIQASNSCNDVYAYPNPVRPEYVAAIAIKNVFAKSIIKITDLTGNFIVELNSAGGQAIWDGKNSKGERVPTGIYIALVANEATGKTCKTKIMLID